MSILVTGGTGYIGSHTVVELLNIGEDIVIVDNFVNSKPVVLDRIKQITGRAPMFHEVDLLDRDALEEVFQAHPDITSCIHFAGLKAVGESVSQPLRYYYNNIAGTLNLCDVMQKYGVKTIVFSSSATVYGTPERVPIRETDKLGPTTNPYGETKLMIERILGDLVVADPTWSVSVLRYFNPIGAHASGLIGEDPCGIPNNLLPYVTKVAGGQLPVLHVYGNDYPTPDGTGIRDYIHVVDLSLAHLKALDRAKTVQGIEYYNIGTGQGYSVLEVIRAYEAATGKTVNFQIAPRRPGDIAECYADPTLAKEMLGWEAQYGIADMCRDAGNWQSKNPLGYED